MEKRHLLHAATFICGLLIGGTLVYFMIENPNETAPTTYNSINGDSLVYGIDVSKWQGNIAWDYVYLPCDSSGLVTDKQPVAECQRPAQFAFIRATKSNDIVDNLYLRNSEEAKRMGIIRGAYHFLTDTVSGRQQAELFLTHAQLEPGDLPPVLDIEVDAPGIVGIAKEWLEIVEKHYGAKAIIYTTTHIDTAWIQKDKMLCERDLWLARPQDSIPTKPKWVFWQFSHKGHVGGILDNVVDLNMFNGTQQELMEYVKEKGIK